MKVWLVKVDEEDRYGDITEKVRKYDTDEETLAYAGNVAMGRGNQTVINSIHCVDLGYSPVQVKSYELVLENFKMALREKK